MERRGISNTLIIILVVLGVLIVAVAAYVYVAFFYVGGDSGFVELKNPAEGLSEEEAVLVFDEGFIFYLLASLGTHNLHNPPFSDDTPKIEIVIGDEVFNTEVVNGNFPVKKGSISSEDIRIVTTKLEAVRIIKGTSDIKSSFESGRSQLELVASEVTLFSKGYLKIYDQFG